MSKKIRANKKVWTTRDGAKIPIVQLEDRHLLNIVRYLFRAAAIELAQEVAAGYSVLGSLNGEMAQFFCEQDLDRLEATSEEEWLEQHCHQWETLNRELRRRGINLDYEQIGEMTKNTRLAAEVHFLLDRKKRKS